ncbi:MAG: TonB-dependent receptor [Pseudomonadota bacterium]
MRLRTRSMLFATTATLALSTAALAQDADLEIDPTILDRIVVEGDKINRELKETTAGTTVIDGEVASRPDNEEIDDVVNAEANVLANEGFSLPSIRGVDSTSGGRPSISAGSQPRTPIVIDNVAVPSNESSAISQISVWDVSTVEVARGPQPTSTGRNAIGGAIRVFTNDPTFEREASARIGYFDEQGTVSGAFMLNAPIIDDELAIRVTGEGSLGQSYVEIFPVLPAGFNPEDERSGRVRGKLLYEPSEMPELSVLFSVDHFENEEPIEGFVTDVENIQIGTPAMPGIFAFASSYEDVEQTVYQAKSTYDISDRLTLVSRIAHLDNDLVFRNTGESFFGFDFGATGFNKRQIEGEVFLQFEDFGLIRRGLVGVIHNTEDEEGFNNGNLLPFILEGEVQNTGIYGEIELSADEFMEGLTFIAGGRLEIDDRFRDVHDGMGTLINSFDGDETEFLPKLGIRYEPNENTAYGYTYSRGFRAGGVDVDLAAPFGGLPITTSTFASEFIDQHEVYARGSFMEGRLDLTATGFYYIWEDAQVDGAAVNLVTPFMGGAAVPVGLIGNVPEAIGFGAEFTASYQVSPEFAIRGALGLLETEITEPGAAFAAAGLDGATLPRAPEVTASGGLTWSPFENFSADFDVRYVSETITGLNQPEIDSYFIADASLAYTIETGSTVLQIEGFVKNLFDERNVTFSENNGVPLTAVGRPRTFGAALTAKW